MTQEISGDAPIPAKRAEHGNIRACPNAGGSIKEIQYNRAGALRADIAIPKNKINIDKFPKRFMGQINEILQSELTGCRNILK